MRATSPLPALRSAKAILEAEGLTPARVDVEQMLQSFQGSARDLVDLLEETVTATKVVV